MKISSLAPVATAFTRPVAGAATPADSGAETRTTKAGPRPGATPTTAHRLPWETVDAAVDARVRAQARLAADEPRGARDADGARDGHGGAHGVRGRARSGLAHLRHDLRAALREALGEQADAPGVRAAMKEFGADLRRAFETFKAADDGTDRTQALVDDVRAAFDTFLTKLADAIAADEGGAEGAEGVEGADGADDVDGADGVTAPPAETPAAEPETEPVADPAAEPVADPVADPAAVPVADPAPAPVEAEDSRLAALRGIFEKLVAGLEQRLRIAERAPVVEEPPAPAVEPAPALALARYGFSQTV